MSLSNIIRADIQQMTAYAVAATPPGFIKLDAMELPYRLPETFRQALAAELADAPINYYPNVATCGLQQILRDTFQVPAAAEIALGNGSDELIQMISLLVAQPGATVLALEPSFVMYKHNAALFGLNYAGVPLNDDFTLNLPAVLAAIEQHQPALVFVSYPNNPTGVGFAREQVQAVIDAAPGIVVVDEAYGAFSGDSFLPQAGQIENLVLMRTVSKIGFAGIRVGYAAGCAEIINELAKILPPYNMNQLSLATANFALRHYDWVLEHVEILKQERSRMQQALSQFSGVTAFASEANFITARVPDAEALFAALKEQGILIKKLHGGHPLLNQCLRFTIGTPEQNSRVLEVVADFYR
jgi:histidinol-phosphate aminotransferase